VSGCGHSAAFAAFVAGPQTARRNLAGAGEILYVPGKFSRRGDPWTAGPP